MNENELEIINLDEAANTLSTANTEDPTKSLLLGFGAGTLVGAGLTYGVIALFKYLKARKDKKAAEEKKEESNGES